jgi:hypothetical protein
MAKIDVKLAARDFVIECAARGFNFSWKPTGVISIYKEIDSVEEFCKADSEYYYILLKVPTSRPGSVWGTDGGGVGALHAMRSGKFQMNKSGVNKNFLKALYNLN